MPEISIGLFPDVGASYFLQRMPGHTGLFIALTAVPLNARDALHVSLADHLLPGEARSAVFERLTQLPWRADPAADRALLTQLLQDFGAAPAAVPAANLERHAAAIEALCAGDSLPEVVARIVAYDGEDAWLKRGGAALATGSPTASTLTWELARRARGRSLADVFRLELIVALQCCGHPDIAEGVRALLIDKDNNPRWTPPTLAAVTPAWIAEHFTEPDWPGGTSPLADL
jgi:enoyl-CoA hydratase/carnithine racemase